MWRIYRWRLILRAVLRGIRLRCPECGHGHLFQAGLRLNETCPYCWVRFERAPGESVGAVYLTSAITALLIYGGYFILDALLDSDITSYIAVWIGVVLALNLLFFRLTRALWIVFAYLTGGVYADQDYEREYTAPGRRSQYSEEKP
jgi:uncharacterized protein (DUF983 family)